MQPDCNLYFTERMCGRRSISRCLYVGDGSGDLHACLCLQQHDVVLARDGPKFSLLPSLRAALDGRTEAASVPTVVPWSSGDIVLGAIREFVAASALP